MKMGIGEDQMQGSSGREEKIFVSVRLRPLNVRERARNDVADWECINDETVIYRSHLSISERSMYPTAYTFECLALSVLPGRCMIKGRRKWLSLLSVGFMLVSLHMGKQAVERHTL